MKVETPKKAMAAIAPLFEGWSGKSVTVHYGPGQFPATFLRLELGKLGEMKNPPEFRINKEGKRYRPPCFCLIFEEGKLFFPFEDFKVTLGLGKIILTSERHRVVVEEVVT